MRLTGESGGVGQTLIMIRGWASLVGVVEQQQPEGGMHTGELAAAVLVATSTHMDLTGVTACWPVLTGIQRRHARSYLQYVVLEEESCSASAVCIWILAVGIRFSMSS